MNNFKVSIIIPIYNVEPYIQECLQSVADQTMNESLECILIDDCGTDNSVSITEQYLKTYQGPIHFKLIHHKKNAGLSAARNTGIRAAHGEYLYFLDSDDTLKKNAIATLLHSATIYDADLTIGFYDTGDTRMSQFEHVDYSEFVSEKSLIKQLLLNYDILPVTAANRLIKRSLFNNSKLYFKEGIIHEDNYWTFFLSKYVSRLSICKEKTYNYRLTPGSITNHINIDKETLAFRTMIIDFCNNIDCFEKGAQKRNIFCLLLIAIDAHYYKDKNERRKLISYFKQENKLLLNTLLSIVFILPRNFLIRNKFINLLMKIFNSNSWLCQ